ncbi:hypothetical protein KBC79_05730, partial [Candidatus Woesebacteria bacterium]|nr:hypothetical protein [Candidatus Woesebacteria bacterium]
IECVVGPDQQPCTSNTVDQLSTLRNTPLLFSSPEIIIANVLSKEPYQTVRVNRRLPDTLIIVLETLTYSYRLQTEDKEFVVTDIGTVFERPSTLELPKLNSASELVLENNKVKPEVHSHFLLLLAAVKLNSLSIDSIQLLNSQTLEITLQESKTTVIVNPSLAANQLQTALVILKNNKVSELSDPVQKLDMRFDLPVLRTTN